MNLNFSNAINEPKEEEEIIKNLVNEIYQYESKIELINNDLRKSENDIHKNIKLKDLNITKEILNLKLSNLNLSLNNSKSKYNALIEQKDSLMIELETKIQKLKTELNNKDIIKFKSILMIKYILSNSNKNIFLTEPQIVDIINDNQKIQNSHQNKKYLLTNEINVINDLIQKISEKEEKIKIKIDEMKDFLLMYKEEKNSTNKELINLISYKETIDTIIKINIHNIINHNNSEINDNQNNSLNNNDMNNDMDNKWKEPIKLYLYELNIIDPQLLAKSLSDNIFSIFDINNDNVVLNNENNNDNENDKFKDSTTFNKNIINNTNTSFENNNFSLNISSILPKEKYNIKTKLKNSIKNEFESFLNTKQKNNKSIDNLLNNISDILFSTIEYFNNNEISKNIVIIYLSYFLKSFYYQNIIEAKMKFINKDYKHVKKIYKQKSNQLNTELDKFKNNKNSLNERIKINKEQIKLIENKKEFEDNLKISQEEENYLKICREGNKLISQKNKINEIILLYKDKIKIQENIINNEINKIKGDIDNINNELNSINKGIENEKIKANEKIIENRQKISEKYGKIKNVFNLFKNKHGNNIPIYNKLLNSINETLININKNSNIFKSLNDMNKKSLKEENNKEIVNFEVDLSKIEKVSSSKDRESDLSLKKLKSLKFSNKKNMVKSDSSSSNSFLFVPEVKKDYYYKLYNNNNYGSNKQIFLMNKKLSNKFHSDNNSNRKRNINIFLNKNYNKKKSPNAKEIKNKNNTNIFTKYKKKIQNNNIIYNNNIYLTNNINDNFRPYLSTKKKAAKHDNHKGIIKTKSVSNIFKKESRSPSLFYTQINYILTNNTFCYYREITGEDKYKFNPFENISSKIICSHPLNFKPCSILFNGTFSILKISQKEDPSEEITYSINQIENTIVRSIVKLVVEIYRKFKKIKGNENNNKDIIDYFLEKFVEEEKDNYPKLSREQIKKCALNKYYDFSILLNNGKRIEFIMTSYDDFKEWINGLALIIKNKNYIIFSLEDK